MTSPESADPVLHLSWQPERDDIAETVRIRDRARKAWRKVWLLVGILAVVGLVEAVTDYDPSFGTFCFSLAACSLVLAVVTRPVAIRLAWRRHPAIRVPLTAHVDPLAGITVIGQSAVTHPWSSVQSFVETDRLFVVQLAGYRNLAFFSLAKRGLVGEHEVDRLRALLSSRIATPARV